MQARGSPTRQAERLQQARGLRDFRGQLRLRRVDHWAAQQEIHKLDCNGIHHDCAQNFIDVEVRFEKPGNAAPNGPT